MSACLLSSVNCIDNTTHTGHTGQEALISQASKSLWIRRQASNIMVSMKLSILLPKYINFNESAGFFSVESSPDVYHTIYLMKIPRETLV